MRSAKELEANLSYLLGLKEYGAENKTFLGRILDKLRGNSEDKTDTVFSPEEVEKSARAKTASANATETTPAEPIVATTQVEVAGGRQLFRFLSVLRKQMRHLIPRESARRQGFFSLCFHCSSPQCSGCISRSLRTLLFQRI